jgi:hypothetical protein
MSETRETRLDLPGECDHIVDRALAGANAMVQMGCLVGQAGVAQSLAAAGQMNRVRSQVRGCFR